MIVLYRVSSLQGFKTKLTNDKNNLTLMVLRNATPKQEDIASAGCLQTQKLEKHIHVIILKTKSILKVNMSLGNGVNPVLHGCPAL